MTRSRNYSETNKTSIYPHYPSIFGRNTQGLLSSSHSLHILLTILLTKVADTREDSFADIPHDE